jgi:hypothetical protein
LNHSSEKLLPRGAKVIAIVNGIAFVLTGSFWLSGLLSGKLPSPANAASVAEAANAASTQGFLIADCGLVIDLFVAQASSVYG